MPKKTLILIIFLALITGGLIYMALTTSQTPSTLNQTPTTTTEVNQAKPVKKTAQLSFDPASLTITPLGSGAAKQTVNIMVKTQGQIVSGAQIELQFDPLSVSNLTIDAGTDSIFGPSGYFVIPLNVDYQTGRATYAVAVGATATPKATEGKVATVTFTAKKHANLTTSVIAILDKSIVTEEGTGESILTGEHPLTLHFTQ